jgi:hypothetical protein
MFQLFQACFAFTVAQTIMLVRVYAMSGRKKIVFFCMSTVIALKVVFIIVLMVWPRHRGNVPGYIILSYTSVSEYDILRTRSTWT